MRFIDVANRKELVDAINSYRGAILIYDGHGKHSGKDDIGYPQLKDEDVNPWSLASEIRCPPIVFACACETHALMGSHVTPANGFLHCGATAVRAIDSESGNKGSNTFSSELRTRTPC